MSKNELPIPHPGDVLREDFMKPLGLTAYRVAKDLGIQQITLSLILRGRRAITAEMSLRLARYTGTDPDFWLTYQKRHELRISQRKMAKKIEREVHLCPLLQAV